MCKEAAVSSMSIEHGADLSEVQRSEGVAVDLPREYNEYVVMADHLLKTGVWDRLKSFTLKRRAGAYEVCDLVLFLLCLFTSTASRSSIADFAASSSRFGAELAGLMDRLSWMTQGSVSRALSSVDIAVARSVSRELLLSSSMAAARFGLVAKTGYRDGCGKPWEVFHWDTTVTPLRERALPKHEDLPEATRLGKRIAAKGYSGRKRADLQLTRSTVSDAATGQWLAIDFQAGNGDLANQIRQTADVVISYLEHDKLRLSHSVVVADGVSGGIPQAKVLRSSGLRFLTRLGSYDVLDQARVRKRLETGVWTTVRDSLSGPRREAMELGTYNGAGLGCRLVVSRFPAKGKKQRGAGTTIEGWHYELFITDLPQDGWAAPDLVTLYYGRTAIENRFGAEDRQFGLDRVLSYTTEGQLIACSVALAVWNLRLVLGLSLVPQDVPDRELCPRPAPPEAPQVLDELDDDELQGPAARSMDEPPDGGELQLEVEARAVSVGAPESSASSEEPEPACEGDRATAMAEWCARHPGWHSNAESPSLECPAGNTIRLSGIYGAKGRAPSLRFRAVTGICDKCAMRSRCAPTSKAPHFRREVHLRIDTGAPAQLPPASAPLQTPCQPKFEPSGPPAVLPPYLPAAPILLPAVLRRRTTDILATASVAILAVPLDDEQIKDFHLALSDADRQREVDPIVKTKIREKQGNNHHGTPVQFRASQWTSSGVRYARDW